jgi:hypothetical protein
MPTRNPTLEKIEYRLVLLMRETNEVLAEYDGGSYRLPRVNISRWTRPAEELQKVIKVRWHLSVIILDFPRSADGPKPCAVAELRSPHDPGKLTATGLDRLHKAEIDPQQQATIVGILVGGNGERGPFSRIGWIDEAIHWLSAETGKTLSSQAGILQYNASGAFALVRFRMRDGSAYWMKATGASNAHELDVTAALSALCPEYLPPLIAVRNDWNAWLMKDAGQPLEVGVCLFELEQAVVSMAALQKATIGLTEELLAVGVVDQRVAVLRERSKEVFDYLEEAMAQQTSTEVPRLERRRLSEIGHILEDACFRMEALHIPDTVMHGDMNRGNILFDGAHCRFTDWSETYIGNPFVTFQHLSLLNTVHEQQEPKDLRLKEAYKRSWIGVLDTAEMDEAFALIPLLTVASCLYGRGDWLRSSHRNDLDRQRYARSLARHMDRAAQAPQLLEALCH